MSLVAIVGRQNVGKSTLFNKIIGRRTALVSDMPGVTRDRNYGEASWCGVNFTLVDTGGLSFDESDAVESKVHNQSMVAHTAADVVICLFDGRDGVTNMDRDIVRLFRKSGKKFIFAVNKADTERLESVAAEFGEFGIEAIPISAEHSRNLSELLDKVISLLPEKTPEYEVREGLRIALVGRPNVGKSTIINFLSNEDRVVAHEMPGTTRDTIDVEVQYKNKTYTFVDTAGIKKRAKTTDKIDKFSTIKSLKAIEDANIVFVVMEAVEGLNRQDHTLVAHAFNSYKPTAILLNKWDKMESKITEKEYIEEFRYKLKELHDLPILCISGKTGYSCNKIFSEAVRLDKAQNKRVTTSKLNRFFKQIIEHHPAPDYNGRQVKLNYITQVDVKPPIFYIFVNQPKGVKASYKRYIINGLRKLLEEPIVPIILKIKDKS